MPKENKNQIIEWIKKRCETEYNKLKKDNERKPKWEDINKKTKIIIKEIITRYLENIFK